MTKFETLFGVDAPEIKNTCVLLPLPAKSMLNDLGIDKLSKGKLYSSGHSGNFSAIITGMGAGMAGDAVLYLRETGCQNIILFGSCGLTQAKPGMDIGALVSPVKSYSMESFSSMLFDKKTGLKKFSSDKILMENLLKDSGDVKKVTCATLGSLKLEEGMIDLFIKQHIDVVDMECSSVFSASQYIKRNAIALFYITDIINEKPFYSSLNDKDRSALSSSIKKSCHILCDFIKNDLTS
jgi:purine-nucleoside phosphorylase